MPDNFDTKVIVVSKKSSNSGDGKKSAPVDEEKPIPVPKTMGKAIVKARSEKEMNQKDLATKSNVPVKTISDWENGKGVYKKAVADKLSKTLGIDLKLEKKPTDKK